jgi:hypothetical protein
LASRAVTVKFLRHFTSVVLVLAVIVGLGMLWAHASGSGRIIGSGIGPTRSREVLLRLREFKAGIIRTAPSDDGLHLSDTRNLIRTCEIEAVLAAVVITVSAMRWRRRRIRRAAATKA